MAVPTPETQFTRDILGNYVCNTFAEATSSGPFDVVIIGGGTFGLVLAQDLFFRTRRFGPGSVQGDSLRPANYRILVLEGGPFSLPEHTQDIPNLQLYPPGTQPSASSALPATRQELIAQGKDRQPILENWGLPWNSTERFGGLAYTLGGRSLYFGGWSPRYLQTEMHTVPIGSITAETLWPAAVVQDLTLEPGQRGFQLEAAQQTGVSAANDFINGALHNFYRQARFGAYGAIPNTIPLAELPDYTAESPEDTTADLRAQLNAHPDPANPARPDPAFVASLKLDAPLAVQAIARPGFFPFNKFSSVPLGITGARAAIGEAGANNNAFKRLMIVPNCHVKRLTTRSYTLATGVNVEEVVGIDTSDGFIDLSGTIGGNSNRRPMVVLALGAIESARVARLSVPGVPNANQIGANFMVHLRKNVSFTVPLPAVPNLTDQEVSALLVRCRANLADGTPVHFHLQITASAVPPGPGGGGRSDVLLFQNVPDLDNIRIFSQTPPGQVDVSIRAVGEMVPNLVNNSVVVPFPPDNDEFTVARATVNVVRSATDNQVMNLMDAAIDAVAQQVFGVPAPQARAAGVAPDGLGTTYHESGTLRMGDDPALSVVNADSQFHSVTNLYAGDASVLPTCGSANPVMNGVALRRRQAKRIAPEGDGIGNPPVRPVRPFFQPAMPAVAPLPGTVIQLFDGHSLTNWRMAGRGTFHAIDGALQSVPSFDLGLLWCTIPMPQNYRLELEFFTRTFQTNSGVFVRFRNPESTGYYNPAWSAVFIPGMPVVPNGFEVQIDNTGAPDGLPKHQTGAVYAVNYPGDPNPDPTLPPAQPGDFVNPQNALVQAWNQYRVEVRGDAFTVNLNSTNTSQYTNTDPNRGRFSALEPTFIGLQSYSNYSFTTAFRNIRITVL
jgi:choline dehydrogenase-like flavoprotein